MKANNVSMKSKENSNENCKAWSSQALKAFWSKPRAKVKAQTNSDLSCQNKRKRGKKRFEMVNGKIGKKKKAKGYVGQNDVQKEKFQEAEIKNPKLNKKHVLKFEADPSSSIFGRDTEIEIDSTEPTEGNSTSKQKSGGSNSPSEKLKGRKIVESSIFRRDTDMELESPNDTVRNSKSTAVRNSSNSFSEKLESSMFRIINERFYTSDSSSAIQMLKKDPSAFRLYHKGYQHQVNKWPVKPLQVITQLLNERGEDLVVADIGCGEGQLALSVHQKVVHSFDLESVNKHVTVCDAANIHKKLDHLSVDICVFCLSLMGSNLSDFIRSANKVLKVGGSLLIAEVASRFEVVIRNKKKKKSKTVNDTKPFVEALTNFGYNLVNENYNGYFVLFEFCKTEQNKTSTLEEISLKPCLYKKR